jgi:hypothetical protein
MAGAQDRRSRGWDFYCGALCRGVGRYGKRCKQPKAPGRTRCRFHAGLSTGPRTAEGKARVAAAVKASWAKWREQMGLDPSWRYGSTWLSRRKRETAAQWLAANKPEGEAP